MVGQQTALLHLDGLEKARTQKEKPDATRDDRDDAYAWSRTRKGGWRIAQSPILTTTITLLRLKKKGYQSMLEIYMELNPSLCEPPYTRPVRTVVYSGLYF
jgi:hypothetical protein